jgi:hypothetical protein
MKIQSLVVGMIIVGMVLLGTMTFITDINSKHGTTTDVSTINETIPYVEEVEDIVATITSDISTMELSLNIVDLLNIPYRMIRVGWNILKLMWKSVFYGNSVFSTLGTALEESGIAVPNWFISGIFLIIMTILIVIIVSGWYKWRFQD